MDDNDGWWWWWMMIMMIPTYASATCEQPACLSNEALHIGEALLPKVERNVNDVCHKAKCCKMFSEKSTFHWERQWTIIDVWNVVYVYRFCIECKATLQRRVEEKGEEPTLVTVLLERCRDVLKNHRSIGWSISPFDFSTHVFHEHSNLIYFHTCGDMRTTSGISK